MPAGCILFKGQLAVFPFGTTLVDGSTALRISDDDVDITLDGSAEVSVMGSEVPLGEEGAWNTHWTPRTWPGGPSVGDKQTSRNTPTGGKSIKLILWAAGRSRVTSHRLPSVRICRFQRACCSTGVTLSGASTGDAVPARSEGFP